MTTTDDTDTGGNFAAFTSRTEAEDLPTYVEGMIEAALYSATAHYMAGEPGRGEYVLARLGVRLRRLERAKEFTRIHNPKADTP
jgi:hypothetical protein